MAYKKIILTDSSELTSKAPKASPTFTGTATFSGSTSGINYNHLSNLPTIPNDTNQQTTWNLNGGNITTISHGETVTISGSGATSVSQSGNTVTISSTDTNTQYAAGSGIALSGTTFSVAAGTSLTQNASGLSVTSGGIGATQLANSSVTTAKIANDAVDINKIGTDAVHTDQLKDGGVTASKIASNAVTTAKIANDAVTNAKLANNSVAGDIIQDESINQGKLADDSVSTGNLENSAVTKVKIANNSVDYNKMDIFESSQPSTGQVLIYNNNVSEKISWSSQPSRNSLGLDTNDSVTFGNVTATNFTINGTTSGLKQYVYFVHNFTDDISTSTHYLPWTGTGEQTTPINAITSFNVPQTMKFKRFVIKPYTISSSFTLTVRIYRALEGSTTFSQMDGTTVSWFHTNDRQQRTIDDGTSSSQLNFTASKGENIAWFIDSSSDPGASTHWWGTSIWEINGDDL